MPIDRGPTKHSDGEGSDPVHPKHAFVRDDGYRDLMVEAAVYERRDGAIVVRDLDLHSGEPVAISLELTAHGVDWLIELMEERVHPKDMALVTLKYGRELAKEKAWDRAVKNA